MPYLGCISISFEKITFYTEILPGKVELFFTHYTREKRLQINFSRQNFTAENSYECCVINISSYYFMNEIIQKEV